jgi:hypothetical protein
MRLLKVTAWVRRAVNNFRKRLNKNECVTTNLTAEEINRAEIEWVKVTQCEIKEQDNYKQLVRKLGLVEEDGILRCTDRLGNSDLELDAQKPILFDVSGIKVKILGAKGCQLLRIHVSRSLRPHRALILKFLNSQL